MSIKYPPFLVAIDAKRNRIFVLMKPRLIAVKRNDVWYYGEQPTDEEISDNYELVTNKDIAQSWVEEAKTELRIP